MWFVQRLLLTVRCRLAGVRDGKALIPDAADLLPPKFLCYLRDIGDQLAATLERRWLRAHRRPHTRWVREELRCSHLAYALERAANELQDAARRRRDRGTYANIKALARAVRQEARVRARLEGAERRRRALAAQRQNHYQGYLAKHAQLCHWISSLSNSYADANVRHRDGSGVTPPALQEANLPRMAAPRRLADLEEGLSPHGPSFSTRQNPAAPRSPGPGPGGFSM